MGRDEDAPVKGRVSSPCPTAPCLRGLRAGTRQCPSNKHPWLPHAHQVQMCVLPSPPELGMAPVLHRTLLSLAEGPWHCLSLERRSLGMLYAKAGNSRVPSWDCPSEG